MFQQSGMLQVRRGTSRELRSRSVSPPSSRTTATMTGGRGSPEARATWRERALLLAGIFTNHCLAGLHAASRCRRRRRRRRRCLENRSTTGTRVQTIRFQSNPITILQNDEEEFGRGLEEEWQSALGCPRGVSAVPSALDPISSRLMSGRFGEAAVAVVHGCHARSNRIRVAARDFASCTCKVCQTHNCQVVLFFFRTPWVRSHSSTIVPSAVSPSTMVQV